ncbi:MAG: hypothetical protein AB3N16_01700 [Flavobacteriaceae bacterium]
MKHPFPCIALFSSAFFLLLACSVDRDVNEWEDQTDTTTATNGDVVLARYSFDTDANSKLMFQDDEALEDMVSEWKRYEIANMLRIKPVDEFTIEVANFAPVDLDSLVISATIGEKTMALFAVDKIRAHAYATIRYPFVGNTPKFNALEGTEVIDLSHLQDTGIPGSDIRFDFHGDSEMVGVLKGLSGIGWKPRMKHYDQEGTHPNWSDDLLPVDARRYTALMINWAYMFTTAEFKEAFLAEPIYENDGETLFTQERKEEIWAKMVNKGKLNLGITSGNAAGLGGGNTFGLYRQIVERFLVSTKNTASTSGHEFGHIVGFNHSSSMTYPKEVDGEKRGFSKMCTLMMKQFLEEGRFPITIDNYYRRSDYNADYVNPSGKEIPLTKEREGHGFHCGEVH